MSMKLGMPNSEIGSNFIINFSLTQFYLAHDAKKKKKSKFIGKNSGYCLKLRLNLFLVKIYFVSLKINFFSNFGLF